jgi:hypothetical protein
VEDAEYLAVNAKHWDHLLLAESPFRLKKTVVFVGRNRSRRKGTTLRHEIRMVNR